MNDLIAVEKIAQGQKLKTLVLDSVSSPITKRVYNMALEEFMAWVPASAATRLHQGHRKRLAGIDAPVKASALGGRRSWQSPKASWHLLGNAHAAVFLLRMDVVSVFPNDASDISGCFGYPLQFVSDVEEVTEPPLF